MAHVAHLKKTSAAGNLVVCGPFANDLGAVLIIDADSKQAVEVIVQSDPFIKDSYYQYFFIREFIKADEKNNFLMSSLSFKN